MEPGGLIEEGGLLGGLGGCGLREGRSVGGVQALSSLCEGEGGGEQLVGWFTCKVMCVCVCVCVCVCDAQCIHVYM